MKNLTWSYIPRRSNFEQKFQRAAFRDGDGHHVFTVTANFGEDVRAKADAVLVAMNGHAPLVEELKSAGSLFERCIKEQHHFANMMLGTVAVQITNIRHVLANLVKK